MGLIEAAHFGVPVLVTPMTGDGHLNAAAVIDRGIGVIVQYDDLTADAIMQAMEEITEPTITAKTKEISFSLRNRPTKPLDLAVWWVEYVATLSGSPLTKSSSTFLSGFVYHSWDVYSVLAAVIVGFITASILLVNLCCCFCRKRNEKETSKI